MNNRTTGSHFFIYTVLINVVLLVVIYNFFFNTKDYSREQKQNAYRIGVSYMTMNNEFYRIINEEIASKVEERGDVLILRDPALDAKRQEEQILQMLKDGIDALVLTPVDYTKIENVLLKAKQSGVRVVVVDTDVPDSRLVDCTITSANYKAGVEMGKYYLTQHEKSDIILMTHYSTKSGQERINGFKSIIRKNPNIRIVDEIECEGQVEIAMPRLVEAIEKNEQFDSVFCLNDPAAVGAVAALEEKGLLDQVKVYGVDGAPDAKGLIYEGMMAATMAQSPTKIGKKAVDAVYTLLDGGKAELTIRIDTQLVTKDNVETYGINRWQ